MNPDAIWWLRLASVPGVGPIRFRSLLGRFGGPERILSATVDELVQADQVDTKTARAIRDSADEGWVERQMKSMEEHRTWLLTIDDSRYPARLRKLSDAPPLLFVRGGWDCIDRPAVAIVGSRDATYYGKRTAESLAGELGRRGFVIVSGMARGIDSAAHRGALAAGMATVAVLGCGVDVVYPRENRELRDRIQATGAVISEYPMGEEPLAAHFPNRNRVITGLSLGVIAVEARGDSGVFSSVRWALDQGREVFAVPGPITSAASFGTNRLIKQGAKLVQTVDDILEEIAGQLAARPHAAAAEAGPALDKDAGSIFHVLSDQPAHVDEIAQQSQRTIRDTLRILFDMEMRGLVKQLPGKMYIRSLP